MENSSPAKPGASRIPVIKIQNVEVPDDHLAKGKFHFSSQTPALMIVGPDRVPRVGDLTASTGSCDRSVKSETPSIEASKQAVDPSMSVRRPISFEIAEAQHGNFLGQNESIKSQASNPSEIPARGM